MELYVKIFLFVSGGYFIFKGIKLYYRNLHLQQRGKIVEGEIVEIKRSVENNISIIVAYRDFNSEVIEFRSHYQKSYFKKYALKEKVEVIIIEDEDIAEINNKFYHLYVPISTIVTGIGVIVATIYLHSTGVI